MRTAAGLHRSFVCFGPAVSAVRQRQLWSRQWDQPVPGYPGGDPTTARCKPKLQKRLTNHFTTLSSFTWAKLITTTATRRWALWFAPWSGAGLERPAVRALGQPAGCEIPVHGRGVLRSAHRQGPGTATRAALAMRLWVGGQQTEFSTGAPVFPSRRRRWEPGSRISISGRTLPAIRVRERRIR